MTVKQIYSRLKQNLRDAGIVNYSFEALSIMNSVFSLGRKEIIMYGDKIANEKSCERALEICTERQRHYPLQYLLGEWSFYGYRFKVGNGVLIPRDDTEVLLECCINFLNKIENKTPKIIDLCSGSGALAVSLSKLYPQAEVTAVEKSDKAYEYLTENIKLNGASVKAILDDVFVCFKDFDDAKFDLILSNPPYIKTDELKSLQAEVQFEPTMALDGGSEGYIFYESIIKNWTSKLKHGGMLAFELGENQSEYTAKLMLEKGYKNIRTFKDLNDTYRAINGTVI